MKNRVIATAFLIAIVFLSSCKKDNAEEVKVVRDCTGTYLRWNEKDYQVCNLEKVATYPDNSYASLRFKRIGICNGSAIKRNVCNPLHPTEGWVEVE
jgi:hypothetical protein